MNDQELKEIIIGRGWIVGVQSIFQTNSRRQAMLRNIRDERRAVMAKGNDSDVDSSVQPYCSNKPGQSDGKKTDAQDSKNVAFSLDKDYPSFKMFYRQSAINTMLKNCETNSWEFDINLQNFVKLEETCQDNQYHFNSDLFVAYFNEFTLHRGGRSAQHDKSSCTKMANDKSTVVLNVKTLLKTSDHNTKLVLRGMLNNVGNDEMFDKLFQQLLADQTGQKLPTVQSRKSDNVAMERGSGKRTDPKDNPSRIKRSKKNFITPKKSSVMSLSKTYTGNIVSADKNSGDYLTDHNEAMNKGPGKKCGQKDKPSKVKQSKKRLHLGSKDATMSYSTMSKDNALPMNKNLHNYSAHHKKDVVILAVCDKTGSQQCTSDYINDYCTLNVPSD